MPRMNIEITEEQSEKLSKYKAAKGLSSKEKAVQALIDEINVSIKVS